MSAVTAAHESARTSDDYTTGSVRQEETQMTGHASGAHRARGAAHTHPNEVSAECDSASSGKTTSGSRATSDARASTQPSNQGYAEDPLARLKADPEYKELLEYIKAAEDFNAQAGFYQIDREFGGWWGAGTGDYKVDWGNIEDAAKNGTGATKTLAQQMLKHPGLFQLLDKDKDGLLSADELRGGLAALRSQKTAMEQKAREAAAPADKNEPGPEAGEAGKTAGEVTPRPELSKTGGLEGASENLNNLLGWSEQELTRLTDLYAKETDPARLKQIENKMNEIQRRMQQITAMLNQVMTLMSNISKMRSDIAMNAIRNIR